MTTPVEFEPVELPSRYAKAIVAILTAALGALYAGLNDDVLTLAEGLGVAVFVANVVGVTLVPLFPAGIGRWSKMLVAIAGMGLQAAVPMIVDGTIPASGWMLILIATLGAISVGIVPNQVPTLAPVRTLPMGVRPSE